MSNPESSARIASTLQFLADAVQDPAIIDASVDKGELTNSDLVMTSMGNYHKALLTPFYNGIQFESVLPYRLEMAGAYGRHLVEAVLGYSRSRSMASVTLRLTTQQDATEVLETSWKYPLEAQKHTSTTWEVVAAVGERADQGQVIPARSGLVIVTPERAKKHNWAISQHVDSEGVAEILHQRITDGLSFTRL